jgi:hypothetical protein
MSPVRACPCLATVPLANHTTVPRSFLDFNCITSRFSLAIRPHNRICAALMHTAAARAE